VLGEIGVPDDHVEPAVLGGVAMRLIPGVDDGALQGGLETDLLFEEVRPLGQLEIHFGAVVLRADLAGAGEDLTCNQEGGGEPDHVPERCLPGEQVVLVGAVGVALAVGVVLVERHPLARNLGGGPAGGLHHHLADLVVEGPFERVVALGGGVLGVGVVHIETSAIGQHRVDHRPFGVDHPKSVVPEAPGIASGGLLLVGPLHLDPVAGIAVDDQ
jgi:hypothetical protein